jgi:hypothetical protein
MKEDRNSHFPSGKGQCESRLMSASDPNTSHGAFYMTSFWTFTSGQFCFGSYS